MQELVRYARALLILQLKQLELAAESGTGPTIRSELLLADAGFGTKEIANILGKNYAAVAKAVSRARSARAGDTAEENGEAGGDRGE
jgi:DNA-directed RNA polymerase specialized sigma24 family protein